MKLNMAEAYDSDSLESIMSAAFRCLSISIARIVVVHDLVLSTTSFLVHIVNMSQIPHMPPYVSVSGGWGECIMDCFDPL